MTTKVSVTASSLRGALSHWLERAQKGERIVVIRHGQPIAEISPPRTSAEEPRPEPIRPAPDVYLERLQRAGDGLIPSG